MEKNYFWFLYILGVDGWRPDVGEGPDVGVVCVLQQPHPCKYSGCTPMCMGVSPPPKKHKYF